MEGKTFLEVSSDMRSFVSHPRETASWSIHPVSTLWRANREISIPVLPPQCLPEGPTPSVKVLTNEPTGKLTQAFFSTLDLLPPDKLVVVEGKPARKLRQPQNKKNLTKLGDTVIQLERPPLFHGTTCRFRDHGYVDGEVTVEKREVLSYSRSKTSENKMTTTEKYAMALISISGQCEVRT